MTKHKLITNSYDLELFFPNQKLFFVSIKMLFGLTIASKYFKCTMFKCLHAKDHFTSNLTNCLLPTVVARNLYQNDQNLDQNGL